MKGIKLSKPIKLKRSIEIKYKRDLLSLIKSMYKGISREALQLFETKDVNYIRQSLDELKKQYSHTVERESNYIVGEFINSAKTDIRKTFSMGWNYEYDKRLQADIINNVSLIKDIPDKSIFNISQDVFNSIANNENNEALEFKLKDNYGITERRANTIARDQTQKMFGTMNEITQSSNGFDYYQWSTAHDERVSTGYGGHKQLDGKIFKWNETVESRRPIIDGYGTKGKPTDRVNCRCVAIPVIVEYGYEMVWDNGEGSYKPMKK